MSLFLFLTMLISPVHADGLTTLTTCAILTHQPNYIRFDVHPRRGEGIWYESLSFVLNGQQYLVPLEVDHDTRSFVGVVFGIEKCGKIENMQYE